MTKFLGCRDPRLQHEYLDSGQIWVTITEEGENGDESDKHLEARDRRYSCLKWRHSQEWRHSAESGVILGGRWPGYKWYFVCVNFDFNFYFVTCHVLMPFSFFFFKKMIIEMWITMKEIISENAIYWYEKGTSK